VRGRAVGTVVEILEERDDASVVAVETDGILRRAWSFERLSGHLEVGDRVLINTSAVELGLGTGGLDFVVANLRTRREDEERRGHIMKLRYTPMQTPVLAVEEPDSPWHQTLREARSLKGTPVIVLGLHSQLTAVCATAKAIEPKMRIVYVMTDGAALPITVSTTVGELVAKGLLEATITGGNSFGGDYEAVNVYSALLAAKLVAGADLIVAGIGPGVVGTSTHLGHTGIDQGTSVNAALALDGLTIAVPRIAFGDVRQRHQGVSHHTLAALGLVAMGKCTVTLAAIRGERGEVVARQLQESGIFSKHHVVTMENDVTLRALEEAKLRPTTMGRTVEQEPEFFMTAGVAPIWALLEKGRGA